MHVSAIRSDSSPSIRFQQYGADGPLKGRACCDWKKSFLVATLALLIAQIALNFFLNLPMLALLVTGVAVGYLIFYRMAIQAESKLPTLSDFEQLQQKVEKQASMLKQEKEKCSSIEAKKQQELQREKEAGKTTLAELNTRHTEETRRLQDQHTAQSQLLKEQIELLQKQIDRSKEGRDQLTEVLQGQLKSAQTRVDDLHKESQRLAAENKTLKENPPQNTRAQAQLQRVIEEKGKVERELKELQSTLEKKREEFKETISKIDSKKIELAGLDENTQKLNSKYEELRQRIELTGAQKTKELEEKFNARKTQLETEIKRLKAEKKALETK